PREGMVLAVLLAGGPDCAGRGERFLRPLRPLEAPGREVGHRARLRAPALRRGPGPGGGNPLAPRSELPTLGGRGGEPGVDPRAQRVCALVVPRAGEGRERRRILTGRAFAATLC